MLRSSLVTSATTSAPQIGAQQAGVAATQVANSINAHLPVPTHASARTYLSASRPGRTASQHPHLALLSCCLPAPSTGGSNRSKGIRAANTVDPSSSALRNIAQQAHRAKGKVPSEECVRKRFKTASHTTTTKSTCKQQTEFRGICSTECHHEAAMYKGKVIAFKLQSENKHGRPNIRLCAKTLIHNPEPVNTYETPVIGKNEIHLQHHIPALSSSLEILTSIILSKINILNRNTIASKTSVFQHLMRLYRNVPKYLLNSAT
ncbi:hypothetical protein ST47_g945 [Ascochyta rabiei]|uniref:Uncharacterized protein n=1 Tax=Didymella rabiei TaxID=5454 RepID=A0A163LLT5_DIDRA|nr:hypothetical protein ST47_g945 [Ascochyta rabiei]